MTPEDKRRLFELFGAYTDGTITEAEHHELQETLSASPEARRLWFLHNDVEQRLYAFASSSSFDGMNTDEIGKEELSAEVKEELTAPSHNVSTVADRSKWQSFSPLLGAVSGAAFGVLVSSLVFWAIALPRGLAAPAAVSQQTPLLQDSFEAPGLSCQLGFPSEYGRWGGRPAHVVGPDGSVQPEEGQHMLRFEPGMRRGKLERVFYVIDLTEHQAATHGDVLHVEVSGALHAGTDGKRTCWNLRAAAFAEEPKEINPEWMEHLWHSIDEHSLAHAARGYNTAETDPNVWQKFTYTIDVPATAHRLVIAFGALTQSPGDPIAYYLDNVHVSLLGTR